MSKVVEAGTLQVLSRSTYDEAIWLNPPDHW
jgi:hypothetical protein